MIEFDPPDIEVAGPDRFWDWGRLIANGIPSGDGVLVADKMLKEYDGDLERVVGAIVVLLTEHGYSLPDVRAAIALSRSILICRAFGRIEPSEFSKLENNV